MTTLGILSRPRSAAAAPNSALSGGGDGGGGVRPPPLKQERKSAEERKTRRARKALLALCSFALGRSSPVGRRKAEREERDERPEKKQKERSEIGARRTTWTPSLWRPSTGPSGAADTCAWSGRRAERPLRPGRPASDRGTRPGPVGGTEKCPEVRPPQTSSSFSRNSSTWSGFRERSRKVRIPSLRRGRFRLAAAFVC